MRCAGALRLEKPYPDKGSSYADEGTAAHAFAATALEQKLEAAELVGRTTYVKGRAYVCDADMAKHLDKYLAYVRSLGGTLLIEQKLNYGAFVGLPDQFGTGDAIVVHGDTIEVVDLKYGAGVAVEAEDNEQLKLYAIGALHAFSVFDIRRVRMTIAQPRFGPDGFIHTAEIDVADLIAFAEEARIAGTRALDLLASPDPPSLRDLQPSEKACRWCKAAGDCPAIQAAISDAFVDSSDTPTFARSALDLAQAANLVPLAKRWIEAVEQELQARLESGVDVPGYKLVEGRKGNREWVDPAAAEEMLKKFRLRTEEMYDFKLISPTSAEKILASQPKRWAKVAPLIHRAPGHLKAVPSTDKRPAVKPAALFEPLDVQTVET